MTDFYQLKRIGPIIALFFVNNNQSHLGTRQTYMKIKLSPTRILATGALLLSAGAANAAIYSFTTAGNSTTNLTIGGVSTVQRNYTGVSVTGWTNNRNRSGDAAAAAGTANAEFNLAPVASFGTSGIGVQYGTEGSGDGQHAIDNVNTMDFVLLSFASPIALTDLQIGWPSATDPKDTDFTVLAFTGANNLAGSPTTAANGGFALGDMNLLNSDTADTGAGNGQSYGLTNAGWEVIGNPNDLPTNSFASIGNSSFKSSSYWLVGTRNKFLATGSDYAADFGKLVSVKGCTSGTTGCTPPPSGGVPEPSSLALLGLGLIGTTMKRWRKKA